MTESFVNVERLSSVTIPALKSYLGQHGYLRREAWGEYLDRFSRKAEGCEQNIFVPTIRSLRDYERRVFDALQELAIFREISVNRIMAEVANYGYEVLRIKVNEGRDQPDIPYDTAIDLLRGGFALVDSSAVLTTAGHHSSYIQGRRSELVRQYLDKVRVGQTEVGSFVLTLLLPTAVEDQSLELPEEEAGSFGSNVADTLSQALKAAERSTRPSRASVDNLIANGLTANFSRALSSMLKVAGDLSIGVAHPTAGRDDKKNTVARFSSSDVSHFARLEQRLKPEVDVRRLDVAGTIEELREPNGKSSGTIGLRCSVDGEERSVRMKFTRDQRPIIIEALERKSEVFLAANGLLIEKSGRFKLDEVKSFTIMKRGELA